jgi:hypothetical protein
MNTGRRALSRQNASWEQDYGWVAKVKDWACRRQNWLICKLPYGYDWVYGWSFVLIRSLWVLSFLCLYAGPTYRIVLTIVHSDGTSILSLHTSRSHLSALYSILRSSHFPITPSLVNKLSSVILTFSRQFSFAFSKLHTSLTSIC